MRNIQLALSRARTQEKTAVPWRPRIDLLLFVHRGEGVEPGLYALLRDPSRQQALRAALHPKFLWVRAPRCPDSLPLFLLEAGDARAVARRTSCNQEIAADGAFACTRPRTPTAT